MSEFAL